MTTYVLGDIQGCHDALHSLLGVIGFDPASDRLCFVGDLVNRGPDSLGVLRFVRALGERAAVVQGNHDLHLCMRAQGASRRHTDDTLDAVLAAPDADELLAWLRAQPLCRVIDGHVLVHAGLLPRWSVAQAVALSGEVQAALIGPQWREFLANLWGSEPAEWDDDLQGWARLRVVVNAMTRMRFCSPQGVMALKAKGPPEAASPGMLPWFEVPGAAWRTHTVVCGHWSALGLRMQPGVVALDTGCVWGGALTALRLEDHALFQVPCPRAQAPRGWD